MLSACLVRPNVAQFLTEGLHSDFAEYSDCLEEQYISVAKRKFSLRP